MTKLSKGQSEALTLMIKRGGKKLRLMSENYRRATILALESKGLIYKEESGYYYVWTVTPAGYEALGMTAPVTKPEQPEVIEVEETPMVEFETAYMEFQHLASWSGGKSGSSYKSSNGYEFIAWFDDESDEHPEPESELIQWSVDTDDDTYEGMYKFSMTLPFETEAIAADPIDAPESVCSICEGRGVTIDPYEYCYACDGTGVRVNGSKPEAVNAQDDGLTQAQIDALTTIANGDQAFDTTIVNELIKMGYVAVHYGYPQNGFYKDHIQNITDAGREYLAQRNESVADDTSAGELSVEQRIELAWRDADLAELASLGEPIAPEHIVVLGKFATSAYRFIEQLAKAGNVEAQEFVRDANKLQHLPGDAPIYSYRRITSFSMYDMYEVYNVITDETHPDYTQLEWDDVNRTVYHLNKQQITTDTSAGEIELTEDVNSRIAELKRQIALMQRELIELRSQRWLLSTQS